MADIAFLDEQGVRRLFDEIDKLDRKAPRERAVEALRLDPVARQQGVEDRGSPCGRGVPRLFEPVRAEQCLFDKKVAGPGIGRRQMLHRINLPCAAPGKCGAAAR
ncbi:MAG TPA: hypothetical protein PLL48_11520 [Novosphingobium sp.]|nr:hypothetical protein [Novosphingobium sp.]